MKLEALHSKTQDYGLRLYYDLFKINVQDDFCKKLEQLIIKKETLEEYQLPQLLNIITQAKKGQSYTEYIQQSNSILEESKGV